jgi:hypothetical protein
MPSEPEPARFAYEEAMEQRRQQVINDALTDPEFMRQVRESHAALARGERGTPLRELIAQEQTSAEQ